MPGMKSVIPIAVLFEFPQHLPIWVVRGLQILPYGIGTLTLERNVNDPCAGRRCYRAFNSDDAGSARPPYHRFRIRQRASTRLARGSVAGVGKAGGSLSSGRRTICNRL
jgi:hypothetical protein